MKRLTPRLLVIALGGLFLWSPAASRAGADDTTLPVRPGRPGVEPFWNEHALRFIYAPAFDLPKVEGASTYRFTLTGHDGKARTFTAAEPWAALSPVWGQVPEGYTKLKVEGIGGSGEVVGVSGERAFYRSPGFGGEAGEPIRPYGEAGRAGLKALFDAAHVQHWLKEGAPDRTYTLYCYPNKVIGGLMRGMTRYSTVAESEGDRAAALKIARATADYLLSLRYADGAAYAGVAPTYTLNVDKPTGVTVPRVKDHWLMVPSVVDPAFGFLDLYDATQDAKYLDAAKTIADALVRTQEADGTWPLMVDWQTGKAVAPNRLIPTWVLFLFDRLDRQYHVEKYREARGKAWDWIVANPLKTYEWNAQFEDVKLVGPYKNLAREQACDVAVLLLSDPSRTPEQVAQAEELIRYAEDQFAIWAPVADVEGWRKAMPNRYKTCDIWIVPAVFEQYVCYGPVARSSAILINTYLKAHEVTGNAAYLEKAHALANGMLEGQQWMAEHFGTAGEIPTWNMRRAPKNWLNNSFYSAEAVLNVAAYGGNASTK